jgi:hypothetical protein
MIDLFTAIELARIIVQSINYNSKEFSSTYEIYRSSIAA